MIKGARSPGSAAAKGVCPVCRSMQRLLVTNGKVGLHGRSAANPRGCDGGYQRPLRVDRAGEPVGGGTVVGMRAEDDGPTAQGSPAIVSRHDDGPRTEAS